MCDGIFQYRGCSSKEIELELEPSKEQASKNRQAKCPPGASGKGYCAPVNIDCDPLDPSLNCNQYYQFVSSSPGSLFGNHPLKLTCDEFPFAGSKQGGNPNQGTSICVPGWQQSWQGNQLRGLKSKVGSTNKYILKIDGWDCDSGTPNPSVVTNCAGMSAVRRRDYESTETQTITEDDLFYNLEADGSDGLLLYVGDLDPGVYTYQLNLAEGNITSMQVIDYHGNEYLSLPEGLRPGSGPQSITFNLTDPAYAITLRAMTDGQALSMGYNVTGATGADATREPDAEETDFENASWSGASVPGGHGSGNMTPTGISLGLLK
ncbi:uncharacterized protein BJX67DRAFT_382328 [Aspergillus lucknowensis]|uniref:Deoxyribonuclease NucA/NucB domain-containing protein n=1 Tax=Aspergillus lucknowensis TaxID=176173 RepID=A0ABR4LN27_9EURO